MARVDLRLDWETLRGRTWTFGHRDHPPYSRFVRLLENGRVTGFHPDNVNERRWKLDEGKLSILDAWDRKTTEFDEVHISDDGLMTLLGGFRMHPVGTPHKLEEIRGPSTLKTSAQGVTLEGVGAGRPRKNLVIVRANENSLHHQWPRDLTDEDRSWDLCVSFYGKEENYNPGGGAEYHILQNKGLKYPSIYELLYVGSPLWDYDYVATMDDDIMLTWRDLNELFAICRDYKLDLAQPALDPSGFLAHHITARQWAYILRYTSFVESMTPIFSKAALQECAPTFRDAGRAFGIDNIWPKLLAEPRDAIAIIDKVPVLHTRPYGAAYDMGEELRIGDANQRLYEAHNRVQEYGGVLAKPLNRINGW